MGLGARSHHATPASFILYSSRYSGYTSPSSGISLWSRSLLWSVYLHLAPFLAKASSDPLYSPYSGSHFVRLRSTPTQFTHEYLPVGWAVGTAHGFGPIFNQGNDTTTTPVAVLFFSAMTSAIAPKATLALNICVGPSGCQPIPLTSYPGRTLPDTPNHPKRSYGPTFCPSPFLSLSARQYNATIKLLRDELIWDIAYSVLS